MFYFTSITTNYIPKARVLCKTLKEHNPEAKFVLCLSDDFPDECESIKKEFDYILYSFEMDSIPNRDIFFFKHNVTEICTAVKPFAALEIMKRYNADKVVYLDPDISVFDSLSELDKLLDQYSMVFTPHQLEPESEDCFVVSNEILFLKRGTYNLGFFAVNNTPEGLRFLNWWKDRLEKFCFDDNYKLLKELQRDSLLGMFTDQKWIDLVPAFFDNYYILKDPGYNVSTWNMTKRILTKDSSDKYRVNGYPLRFFHFSGYDSGGHFNEMQRLWDYVPENKIGGKLSKWYEEQMGIYGAPCFETKAWKYANYSDGEPVLDIDRRLLNIRRDIYGLLNNPYEVENGFSYKNWVRGEYSEYYVAQAEEDKLHQNEMRLRAIFDIICPHLSIRRGIAKKIYHLINQR